MDRKPRLAVVTLFNCHHRDLIHNFDKKNVLEKFLLYLFYSVRSRITSAQMNKVADVFIQFSKHDASRLCR